MTAFAEYARRNQTRLEHAGQLHQRLGLRPFARADIRHAVESATAAAWSTDKGGPIAQALMDALRARNIILPSPDTLERVGLAGRAQARRRAAEDLLARVSADQLVRIDKLLVNDPELKMTRSLGCGISRSRPVRPAWRPSPSA